MSDAITDWQSFLSERPIAVFATSVVGGTPHAVPVEVVVTGGAPFVWCESTSVKARNAIREGRATLMAYKGHHGVMVRGPIRVLRPADGGYEPTARLFLDKYEREETYGNDMLISVEPHRVTTW